jgi:hypothetical protein
MFETADLGFAAFLMIRSFKLISAEKVSGRFLFVFEDPDTKANTMSVEYLNSEFPRYDNAVRTLKKLLYS